MELSPTEIEEMILRKRREEGTPCTDETFHKWKRTFDTEMALLLLQQQQSNSNQEEKNKEYDSRPTGYEIFSSKLGLLNLDALEQAADAILLQQGIDAEDDTYGDIYDLEQRVDEHLFVDEDLDDLDFEDDDDDEDNYDDEMDGDDVDI